MGKREITYHHNLFKIKKNKRAIKVSLGISLEILQYAICTIQGNYVGLEFRIQH